MRKLTFEIRQVVPDGREGEVLVIQLATRRAALKVARQWALRWDSAARVYQVPRVDLLRRSWPDDQQRFVGEAADPDGWERDIPF